MLLHWLSSCTGFRYQKCKFSTEAEAVTERWVKIKLLPNDLLSCLSCSVRSHTVSPYSEHTACEWIHFSSHPSCASTDRVIKGKWVDSVRQSEGSEQRKLLSQSSLTVICDFVGRCEWRRKEEGWDERRPRLTSEYIKSWSTLMKKLSKAMKWITMNSTAGEVFVWQINKQKQRSWCYLWSIIS